MAQRSARARSKLDKISGGGIAKPGFGGLATPATSTGSPSVSSFSSRSFGRSNHKSVFRSFLDSHSDKIRGTLAEKINPINSKPKLDLTPEVTQLKRWEGDGKSAGTWDKLRRDPELWMSEGDTLVYLYDKHSRSKEDLFFRGPSFRIHSSSLRATNSPFLIASLCDYEDTPLSPSSMSSTMSQEDIITQIPSAGNEYNGVVHELHIPGIRTTNKTAWLRHHATTRNFFSILFNRAIVGVTLGHTLIDLVDRMELYLPPGYDCVGRLMRYLERREFDDVRNAPDFAAGMLQFAEKFELKELWRECFVHCVGMTNRLELSPEYQQISPITKALIDRANLEIQVRVGKADKILGLGNFQFEDLWPFQSASYSPARYASEKFQKFLVKHYQSRFGTWPPQGDKFSRMLYVQLQRDFDCLYDYLVDREVSWEPGTPMSPLPRKQPARFVKSGKPNFRADDNALQLTDMLNNFDYVNQYPHIPHPFPLVPESKGPAALRTQKQTNFFGNRKVTTDSKQAEKAAALALMEATNVDALYASSHINSLVDAYSRMERSDKAIEIDPHDARKGRWLLIYAILQTLATVTVDAPGLKWTENVDYFLCAQLRGTPPWEQAGPSLMSRNGEEGEDYCQYRSHCWVVPETWTFQSQPSQPQHSQTQQQSQPQSQPQSQQQQQQQQPHQQRQLQQEQQEQQEQQSEIKDQRPVPNPIRAPSDSVSILQEERYASNRHQQNQQQQQQQPVYEAGLLEQDDFDQLEALGMGYGQSHPDDHDDEGEDDSDSSDADDEEDDMEVDEQYHPGHYAPTSQRNSDMSHTRVSNSEFDAWERGLGI